MKQVFQTTGQNDFIIIIYTVSAPQESLITKYSKPSVIQTLRYQRALGLVKSLGYNTF